MNHRLIFISMCTFLYFDYAGLPRTRNAEARAEYTWKTSVKPSKSVNVAKLKLFFPGFISLVIILARSILCCRNAIDWNIKSESDQSL